ncbi:L,D-transpeptidase ErfK/SrfK [Nitrosomonas oligotropha]|uniref:L,D-transpeptidase ErfK/SrfK n=2 Tax=Nitrosomonas oligotropha TaxID=42354 RepID=A0A1H8S693_9PROT|nr:L,D-transpeptidase ErfK/SrfK [Nitrosomonas oligotropha]SEO74056.1 L,D-transpeptidase ErfK/SrfK [Nitrosomonas oligotropha]
MILLILMNKKSISLLRSGFVLGFCAGLFLLSGCQSLPTQQVAVPAPVVKPLPIPVASHEFSFDAARNDVVGTLQVVTAGKDDTLSDIARRFNLGYEEIVSANPGVDPWLPKAGTKIIIPTQFVLPDAPRQGIVINLAAMRLFYYPKTKPGKPQRVITHPVGIGRVEWKTPVGMTRVASKVENPSWIPTPSIRREHAKNGDPLPAVVPPGPDNPMGTHVLKLDWPSYAIHGTDKPPSIGLRGSHGCLRMYPEDIVYIYQNVPVGTPVRIVNQPRLLGWRDNKLYLQAYSILEDDKRNHANLFKKSLTTVRATPKGKRDGRRQAKINQALLDETIRTPRATATPITQPQLTLQAYLDRATRVQNTLPFNATWDGDMSRQLSANDVLEMANEESTRVR